MTGLKIKGGGQPLKLGKIGIRNKHQISIEGGGGGGVTGLKIKGGGQPLKLGKIGIRNKHQISIEGGGGG